jgi:TolB protein
MIAQVKKDTTSYIQMLDIESGKIDTVLVIKSHFEAPNWHPDNYL